MPKEGIAQELSNRNKGSRGTNKGTRVRKRLTLEKVSILRQININLYKVNLTKLVKGSALILYCIISNNKLRI